MEQQTMFTLAVESVNIQAQHEPGRGWRLTVIMRRQGEPWSDAHRGEYSCLSTHELVDVIECELAVRLG